MNRTKTLDRFLDPVGSCLTAESARRLVRLRADARTEKRLNRLAEKNQHGVLTPLEREEYDMLITAIDFVTILQAKARRVLKERAEAS